MKLKVIRVGGHEKETLKIFLPIPTTSALKQAANMDTAQKCTSQLEGLSVRGSCKHRRQIFPTLEEA
jgi:hypothetical protein